MGSKSIKAKSNSSNSRSLKRRSGNSIRNFAAGKKNAVNGSYARLVEEKIEMLKNLLPHYAQNQLDATTAGGKHGGFYDGEVNAQEENDLFRQTADYIVVLRTQVFVLQRLIDFYSSRKINDQNAADSIST